MLELTAAVAVFGSILLPAVAGLSHVATALRTAESAVHTVSRAWTYAAPGDRLATAHAAAEVLTRESEQDMIVAVFCLPDCADTKAAVLVSARVPTRLLWLGPVVVKQRLQRDFFAA